MALKKSKPLSKPLRKAMTKSVKRIAPEKFCDYYRGLDKHFGTSKKSPLHHDNRCPACAPGNRISD